MTPKDVVLLHAKLWKERYGESYSISWKRETAQAKRLLSLYDADKLAAYLRHFNSSYRSGLADRAGHSFNIFVYELPAIIASCVSEQGKRDVTREADFERLEAAKRNA